MTRCTRLPPWDHPLLSNNDGQATRENAIWFTFDPAVDTSYFLGYETLLWWSPSNPLNLQFVGSDLLGSHYPDYDNDIMPLLEYSGYNTDEIPDLEYPDSDMEDIPDLAYPDCDTEDIPDLEYPDSDMEDFPDLAYPDYDTEDIPDLEYPDSDMEVMPPLDHPNLHSDNMSTLGYLSPFSGTMSLDEDLNTQFGVDYSPSDTYLEPELSQSLFDNNPVFGTASFSNLPILINRDPRETPIIVSIYIDQEPDYSEYDGLRHAQQMLDWGEVNTIESQGRGTLHLHHLLHFDYDGQAL